MISIAEEVYEAVWEWLFAGSLLLAAVVVGIGLVVVSGFLYLLGVPVEIAGMIGAVVVGVGGFGAILYGGYRLIDWE